MRIVARMTQTAKKPDYKIPTTNAQGLALVWTKTFPAKLARDISARAGPGKTLSRAATGKWKAVPVERVNDVAAIIGIPREHILPEVYAPVT